MSQFQQLQQILQIQIILENESNTLEDGNSHEENNINSQEKPLETIRKSWNFQQEEERNESFVLEKYDKRRKCADVSMEMALDLLDEESENEGDPDQTANRKVKENTKAS
jgi:hypothetical protein